jgi:concanavalin A-like lectin/glucanase superfamily protein
MKTRLIVTLLLMMNSPVLLAQQGKILSLDGFGDYVDVPDSGSLDILNQITVESWINFQEGGTDNQPRILSKGPDGEGYELLLTSNGASANLEFRIAPDFLISTTILNANVWYHVAATYDGSTIKLLINGTSDASKTASGSLLASTDALNIGQKSQDGFDSSIGFTDEVRVWNIARTQAEIQATMNTTLIGNEPGLVGYWNFDDGTANDRTANGNHGTLVGDARIIEYTVFLDLAALTDVNGNGGADAAVLVAASTTGSKVYVKDGVTGELISEATILDDSWRAIDLAVTPGGANALIGVLAQKNDNLISVAVHRAGNGSFVQEIPFFGRTWVPSKLVYAPNADGPGGSAFAVVAKNKNDGRVAVQLRRRSDGSLIGTTTYFEDNWEPIDLETLADISGNSRPELMVLGHSSLGQIVALVKDASTKAVVNKITYLGKTTTPVGMTVIEDIGGGAAPELPVLGKRPDNNHIVQNRDALSDERVSNVSFFNPRWNTIGIEGLDDINGNTSADLAVLAQHDTTHAIQAEVRDAFTGDLIRAVTFLGSSWDARAFAVFDDINGNSAQELGVVGRNEDGDVRVQLRDASNGTAVKTIAIP